MRESISWYVAGSARRFSVIAVTIGPGCTEFARMPSFAYWMAVTLVSRRTAPLEAGYIGLVMSVPTRPSCDEMLTIEPPPARRMAGMAALLPRNTRSEEHTSELQSHHDLVCRLLLEKKNKSS